MIIFSLISFIVILLFFSIIFNKALEKFTYFKKKKVFRIISSVIISIIIYFTFSTLFFYNLTKISQEKFNETTWVEKKSDQYKMIDDLVESIYLVGKDSLKIRTLFGDPIKIDKNQNIWTYELIGRTWADFKITTLKLYFVGDKVGRFEYSQKIK